MTERPTAEDALAPSSGAARAGALRALWRQRLQQLSPLVAGPGGLPQRYLATRMTVTLSHAQLPQPIEAGVPPIAAIGSRPLTPAMTRWVQGLQRPAASPHASCEGELALLANAAGDAAILGALDGRHDAAEVAVAAARRFESLHVVPPCDERERQARRRAIDVLCAKRGVPADLANVLHLRAQIAGHASAEEVFARILESERLADACGICDVASRGLLADLALSTIETSCAPSAWRVLVPAFARAMGHPQGRKDFADLWFCSPLHLLAEMVVGDAAPLEAFIADVGALDTPDASPAAAAMMYAWLHRLPPAARAGTLRLARDHYLQTPLHHSSVLALTHAHGQMLCAAAEWIDEPEPRGATALEAPVSLCALLGRLAVEHAPAGSAAALADAQACLASADERRAHHYLLLASQWGVREHWPVRYSARQVLALSRLPADTPIVDVFRLLQMLRHSVIAEYPDAPDDALVQVLELLTATVDVAALGDVAVLIDALFLRLTAAPETRSPPSFDAQMRRLMRCIQACRQPDQWRPLAQAVAALVTRVAGLHEATDIVDALLRLPAATRDRVAAEMVEAPQWPNLSSHIRVAWLQRCAEQPDQHDASLALPHVCVGCVQRQQRRFASLARHYASTEAAAVTVRALLQCVRDQSTALDGSSRGRDVNSETHNVLLRAAEASLAPLLDDTAMRAHTPDAARRPRWPHVGELDLLALTWRVACARMPRAPQHLLELPVLLGLCVGALPPVEADAQPEADLAWRVQVLSYAWWMHRKAGEPHVSTAPPHRT